MDDGWIIKFTNIVSNPLTKVFLVLDKVRKKVKKGPSGFLTLRNLGWNLRRRGLADVGGSP